MKNTQKNKRITSFWAWSIQY